MCVVIYKPAGVAVPSADVLRECFISNKDGAGFMYVKDGVVKIRKGFMTFPEVKVAFKEIPKDSAAVMHFRISTSGKIAPSWCHPYPVSAEMKHLKLLKCVAGYGLAHNGIIHMFKPYDDLNDTMTFIKKTIGDPSLLPLIGKNSLRRLIDSNVKNSKIIILSGDGEAMFFGAEQKDWVEAHGCLFSNRSFEPPYAWNNQHSNLREPTPIDSYFFKHNWAKGEMYQDWIQNIKCGHCKDETIFWSDRFYRFVCLSCATSWTYDQFRDNFKKKGVFRRPCKSQKEFDIPIPMNGSASHRSKKNKHLAVGECSFSFSAIAALEEDYSRGESTGNNEQDNGNAGSSEKEKVGVKIEEGLSSNIQDVYGRVRSGEKHEGLIIKRCPGFAEHDMPGWITLDDCTLIKNHNDRFLECLACRTAIYTLTEAVKQGWIVPNVEKEKVQHCYGEMFHDDKGDIDTQGDIMYHDGHVDN